MKINSKTHISLNADDVREMIIKHLYHSQGVGGIFKVEFKMEKDSEDNFIFNGAEVNIEPNGRSLFD